MPNTEAKKSVIEQGLKTAALSSAVAAHGSDEVEQTLAGDVVQGGLEDPERKPSKTKIKVECTISDTFWFD